VWKLTEIERLKAATSVARGGRLKRCPQNEKQGEGRITGKGAAKPSARCLRQTHPQRFIWEPETVSPIGSPDRIARRVLGWGPPSVFFIALLNQSPFA
jgi:hypothetical protein